MSRKFERQDGRDVTRNGEAEAHKGRGLLNGRAGFSKTENGRSSFFYFTSESGVERERDKKKEGEKGEEESTE